MRRVQRYRNMWKKIIPQYRLKDIKTGYYVLLAVSEEESLRQKNPKIITRGWYKVQRTNPLRAVRSGKPHKRSKPCKYKMGEFPFFTYNVLDITENRNSMIEKRDSLSHNI